MTVMQSIGQRVPDCHNEATVLRLGAKTKGTYQQQLGRTKSQHESSDNSLEHLLCVVTRLTLSQAMIHRSLSSQGLSVSWTHLGLFQSGDEVSSYPREQAHLLRTSCAKASPLSCWARHRHRHACDLGHRRSVQLFPSCQVGRRHSAFYSRNPSRCHVSTSQGSVYGLGNAISCHMPQWLSIDLSSLQALMHHSLSDTRVSSY